MRRTVVTICALLTLAACRGPEPIEPTPSPEPTGTTTAAPDPTVTEPTLPDQARRNTPEGAAAFVGYWIQTLNFAARTGETRLLRRISAPRCEGCSSYASLFERTYSAGGYFKDSDWSIRKLRIKQGSAEHLVLARVTAPAGTYKKSAKDTVHKGTPEDSRLAFGVKYSGKWMMTQFGLESELR